MSTITVVLHEDASDLQADRAEQQIRDWLRAGLDADTIQQFIRDNHRPDHLRRRTPTPDRPACDYSSRR